MTRMAGPDCAVMCNLINTHTHTHTHTPKSIYLKYNMVFRVRKSFEMRSTVLLTTTIGHVFPYVFY